jgi:hypothetical protein
MWEIFRNALIGNFLITMGKGRNCFPLKRKKGGAGFFLKELSTKSSTGFWV